MAFFKLNFSPSFSTSFLPKYGFKSIKTSKDDVLFFGGGNNGFCKEVTLYNIPKNSYQKFSLLPQDDKDCNNKIEKDKDNSFSNVFPESNTGFSGLAAFDMVFLEIKNLVVIFGGISEDKILSNDLYVLENYADLHMVQSIGDIPSPRMGLTLTKITENKLILFGGVENLSMYPGEQIIPNYLNDVYILHIDGEIYRWEKIEINFQDNIQPCARESHSSICYENNLIIFGGMNGYERLNDTWMLNLENFQWKKVETIGNILARSMHTATLVDDKMYIFGGWAPLDKHYVHQWKCTNSFQCLDLETMKWKNFLWINRPTARAGHAAIEHFGRIYIWSGREESNQDSKVKCHNDVWCFEAKRPQKVTELRVENCEENSFELSWTCSVNAIYYVVEIKEISRDHSKINKKLKKAANDNECNKVMENEFTEEHPQNIVIDKKKNEDKVQTKAKSKIIIHEDITLYPPNTIDVEELLKASKIRNIEQLDGSTTIIESTSLENESTDSEMETLHENKKNASNKKWYLVGIFAITSCNVKNFVLHVLSNRNSITSENIPDFSDPFAVEQINIIPGKSYNVRVSALNSCGMSESSDIITVQTLDKEPDCNF